MQLTVCILASLGGKKPKAVYGTLKKMFLRLAHTMSHSVTGKLTLLEEMEKTKCIWIKHMDQLFCHIISEGFVRRVSNLSFNKYGTTFFQFFCLYLSSYCTILHRLASVLENSLSMCSYSGKSSVSIILIFFHKYLHFQEVN